MKPAKAQSVSWIESGIGVQHVAVGRETREAGEGTGNESALRKSVEVRLYADLKVIKGSCCNEERGRGGFG